jgi:threonine synthase
MRLTCSSCSGSWPASEPRWRCECGGYLDLETGKTFDRLNLAGRPLTLWRYEESLGVENSANRVHFDEGFTPLMPCVLGEHKVLLKLDYLRPTGSFKDRGTAVMVSKFKEWGITNIVDDSSGNAGASLAAYAAAAGIRAEVFIPSYASAGKAMQIQIYGGTLEKVPGTRENATLAAMQAATRSFYGSHIWSPFFIAGMKTAAYEIAEQLAWQAPDWIVAPVGGGTMIIGLWLGFQELMANGYVAKVPRLAAIQSENCAPVYESWKAGRNEVTPVEKRPSAAEGIAISAPVRGKQILQAIRESKGISRTVTDAQIWSSLNTLASRGVYVEPTAATSIAGYQAVFEDGAIGSNHIVVVPLTGFGLKATDKLIEHFAELASPQ